MINLRKVPTRQHTMTTHEGFAHAIQLRAQLTVLEAWQKTNPNVEDHRVTGLIESIRQAEVYARLIANGLMAADTE